MSTFEKHVNSTKLTKIERKVADYIFKNYEKVCFMKASEIASELNVSNSSVIRLSRTLGYASFTEMMMQIRQELLQDLEASNKIQASPNWKFTQSLPQLENQNPIAVYFTYLNKMTESILALNPLDKFIQARDYILKTNILFIAGFYGYRCVADVFSVHMKRIFPRVVSITHTDPDSIAQLINMTEKDCLILFSCERYTQMAIYAAKVAVSANCKLITVTDRLTAPVATDANVILISENKSGSFFNSVISPIAIAEILTLMISTEQTENIKERLSTIDDYLITSKYF